VAAAEQYLDEQLSPSTRVMTPMKTARQRTVGKRFNRPGTFKQPSDERLNEEIVAATTLHVQRQIGQRQDGAPPAAIAPGR
jgi:hypothetical protein